MVGAPLPDTMVFSDFNKLNKDCDADIYEDGVGLDNCLFSYGHDEYLHHVRITQPNSPCLLPKEALAMVRFHSCYPWHKEGEYSRLESEHDER